MLKQTKKQQKERRHFKIRTRLSGTAERPRLHVARSLAGMYLQLIDDEAGKTLASANHKKDAKKTADAGERKGKVAVGYLLGLAIAEKAKALKVTKVVFDRGGNRYHGRIKAAAEGARDGGLEF